MPLGVVSDEDFDKELTNGSSRRSVPTNPTASVTTINKGRGEGNVEVPDSLRQIIGDSVVTDGRQEAVALAERFGISPSSVSAYGKGATSTSTYGDRPNADKIQGAKDRIGKRARNTLTRALNNITDEKLENTKARELAGIAKDMAAVVKAMEPEPTANKDSETKGPTFVFYAPQFRKEETFDVVYTKE